VRATDAPQRSRLLPFLVAGISLACTGTIAGGVAIALHPGKSQINTAPVPTAQGQVTNVSQSNQVAPLQRVVPPDLLAVAGRSVTPDQEARIRKLKQVQDVIVMDAGAVQLQNHQVNTFAVDPSLFRSWTPPVTATNEDLWAALAADKFVVSGAAQQALGVQSGFNYPILGKSNPSVTMGGSGSLGVPGIDMLVSKKTGGALQLIPSLAVMVNAPGADPAKLVKSVQEILGTGSTVLNLHLKKNQTTTAAGSGGRPATYLDIYRQAAAKWCPGLSWSVLAAIGQVESNHGRNVGPSSAGALGPMQFMPATWKIYGVDGNGDGKADIMNPYDAIPGAANYLCHNGAAQGGNHLYTAIFAYNHADWYVQKVLNLAQAYARAYP
jgi:hypothetical protein